MTANENEQSKSYVHEDVHADVHASPKRTICIAVDNSDHSKHAFQWSIDNIINPESDQVILLNVRPFVTSPVIYSAPMLDLSDDYTKLDEANKHQSHDLIRKYAKELVAKKIKVKGVALRGDPREEIVYKVDDLKADMLIIGSRGMGALKRTFVGSTSDYCVHHCTCPVIVTKEVAKK